MSGTGRRGFFDRIKALVTETVTGSPPEELRPELVPERPSPTPPESRRGSQTGSSSNKRVRPPGALAEAAFLAACTRCGACVAACPEEAIVKGPDDTPHLEPARVPCVLCADVPCAAACPTEIGALVHIERGAIAIGTAQVYPRLCINHHEALACERCFALCPVDGALQADERGIPSVVPAVCTGCGICARSCAAYPSALGVVPR